MTKFVFHVQFLGLPSFHCEQRKPRINCVYVVVQREGSHRVVITQK